jgi:hypothetical protein
MYCGPYSAGVFHSVSDQIQNLQNCFTTPNKMTSDDDIKGLVSLSSFVHGVGLLAKAAGKGWGSPKSEDWRKSLALCDLNCVRRNPLNYWV